MSQVMLTESLATYREHETGRGGELTKCSIVMKDFIQNACSLNEELSGKKLKPAACPYVAMGSLRNQGGLCSTKLPMC